MKMFFALFALSATTVAQGPSFAELRRLTPTGLGLAIRASASFDVDGDGDVDTLVGTIGPERNRLLLNDGHGYFTNRPDLLSADLTSTWAIAAGDLDMDGDNDVLLANSTTTFTTSPVDAVPQNTLLLWDGGAFVASAAFPFDADASIGVVLGDVDGDSDLDGVFLNVGAADRVYLNGGAGDFTVGTGLLPSVVESGLAGGLADVDLDGDLDLYVGISSGDDVLYLWDDPLFAFVASPGALPSEPESTIDLDFGDIDMDGDMDVLVARYEAMNRLYANDGAGIFSAVPFSSPAAGIGLHVELVDVDADGDLDALSTFAAYSLPDDSLACAVNDGSGSFSDMSSLFPEAHDALDSLTIADFDGSGTLDVMTFRSPAPGQAKLYLGIANTYRQVTWNDFDSNGTSTYTVDVGDLDGDGDFDVLAGRRLGGVTQILVNDGSGELAVDSELDFGDEVNVARLADVDGDGALDVCTLSGLTTVTLRWYSNDGSGGFAAGLPSGTLLIQSPIGFSGFQATDMAWADTDSDGDQDLLMAFHDNGAGARPIRIYRNDGAGGLTESTTPDITPPDLYGMLRLVPVDTNADGAVELFVRQFHTNRITLYPNDGAGQFGSPMFVDFAAGNDFDVGDIDADGDLDVVSVGTIYAATSRNDGSNVFTPEYDFEAGVDSASRPTLVDLDQDGDLDVVVGSSNFGSRVNGVYWLENDGTGAWTLRELGGEVGTTHELVVRDFDGDGDLDVFTGRSVRDDDRLLSNLRRQVATRGLPRIGRPFAIDIYGPPNGGWLSGYSPNLVSLPIGAFGTLHLDPAVIVVVGSGLLDSDGQATLGAGLPSDLSLMGQVFFLQALVGLPGSLRLTNYQRLAVLDF